MATEVFAGYLRDQRAYLAPMLVLAREAPAGMPAGLRLAFADAYIRSGHPAPARHLLTALVAEPRAPLTTDWAYLLLGWLDMAAGNFAAARTRYVQVQNSNIGRPIAPLVLGLIDAAQLRTNVAIVRLRAAATAPGLPPSLRPLARIGVAYAHYWARHYEAAASEFERVALIDAGSTLADDASYGAAWARWKAGDHERALERLRSVAEREGRGINPKHIPRGLIELRPTALVRGSLKRYRRVPIGQPADQLLGLLDADGGGLAKAALALISADNAAPAIDPGRVGSEAIAQTPETTSDPAPAPAPSPSAAPSPLPAPKPEPSSGNLARPLALALLLVLGAGWWLLSRGGSRGAS